MGTVTTGAPGTDAAVTNSGTPENAVFDFIIPRGADGTCPCRCSLDVLSTIHTDKQTTAAGGALVFQQNLLVSGDVLSHVPGTANVTVGQTGAYMVFFRTTATGGKNPGQLLLQLYQNGTAVPGAFAQYTFRTADESAVLSFFQAFLVSTVPSTLQVRANSKDYSLRDSSLTILRLGDAV